MPQTWIRQDIHKRLKVHSALKGQNMQEYLDDIIPEVSDEF